MTKRTFDKPAWLQDIGDSISRQDETGRHNIEFNREKLKDLKAAYRAAMQNGEEVFRLDEQDYFVGYAKYLIEYLEGKLK